MLAGWGAQRRQNALNELAQEQAWRAQSQRARPTGGGGSGFIQDFMRQNAAFDLEKMRAASSRENVMTQLQGYQTQALMRDWMANTELTPQGIAQANKAYESFARIMEDQTLTADQRSQAMNQTQAALARAMTLRKPKTVNFPEGQGVGQVWQLEDTGVYVTRDSDLKVRPVYTPRGGTEPFDPNTPYWETEKGRAQEDKDWGTTWSKVYALEENPEAATKAANEARDAKRKAWSTSHTQPGGTTSTQPSAPGQANYTLPSGRQVPNDAMSVRQEMMSMMSQWPHISQAPPETQTDFADLLKKAREMGLLTE